MPTNLYGPGDNYHPENSHVIPALIRRFHEATERGDAAVTIWGTGTPRREFLHTDDLATRLLPPARSRKPAGLGERRHRRGPHHPRTRQTRRRNHRLHRRNPHRPTKPDGTPRKLLDISKIKATGWQPEVPFREGLAAAYQDFKASLAAGEARL